MATRQELIEALKQAKANNDQESINQIVSAYRQLQAQSQGIKSLEPDAGVGDFFESLSGGTKRFFGSAETALEAPFTSGEEAAVRGIRRQEKITERPGASLDAVGKTFEQEGVLGAAGEIISQVPTAIAEQVPVLASIFGGSKLGSAIATGFSRGLALPLPPQLKVASAVLGSLIVPFLSMSGSNMQRKAEEDIKAGRPVDVDRLSAYGTGLVQSAVERAGLGLSGLSKAMGISIPQLMKQGGTEAIEKIAKQSVGAAVGKGMGKLAVAEGTAEATQQMLERYYA